MVKKLFVLSILCLSLVVTNAHADITSYDNTFTTGDVFASDFHTRLNANFTRSLTGGINNITSANIAAATLAESDMADEINPRIRTYEGAACEFVYTGLLPVTGASLTQNTAAGTAYPRGYRINKASATAHTYNASKWTWVDVDINGNFQYSEQSIGSATPSVASNSIRLARVSTDGTTVVSVQDLRLTSCVQGPFSRISDTTGESTLADVFSTSGYGYQRGLVISRDTSTTLKVFPGTAYINGKYRSITSNLTIPSTAASASNGTSGIDTGSVSASTTYYVYAAADQAATKDIVGVISSSASTPTGVTNYRRIGEATTDASSNFTSSDPVTVTSVGKIVQIKKFVTGAVATGTTTTPEDDSIPQITEGDQYMSLSFTPVNANDKLKIDVVFNGADSASTTGYTVALHQDSSANALAAVYMRPTGGGGVPGQANLTYYKTADTTSATTFKVRAGGDGAGTVTFNGSGGGRYYGGVYASSITITEYDG